MLGPCDLKLEVFQELGGKDTLLIGDLTINLSEYANSGLTTRRYLLDDCKFNSTIKVTKHWAFFFFFFCTVAKLHTIISYL